MSEPPDNPPSSPMPVPAASESLSPTPLSSDASGPVLPGPEPAPAPPRHPQENFPEDLRSPWGMPDLILFVVVIVISMVLTPPIIAAAAVIGWGIKPADLLRPSTVQTAVITAAQAAIYLVAILFTFLTVRLRSRAPFWRTIGWRPFHTRAMSRGGAKLACLFGGVGLSFLMQFASAVVRPKQKLPIEQLFQTRSSIIMLMAFGVLLAPLVEETIFRGYLYPVLAREFSVGASVLVTGILFGLMHGTQLAWTPALVALMCAVGIIFTYVRARTGTVVASYFLHLGYNGFIFLGFFVYTGGLRRIPGGQ